MQYLFFIIIFTFLFQTGFSQNNIEKNFKAHFEKYGVDGCFVLFDPSVNEYTRYNAALCDTGYIPASTFKIPHSLIAMEEGVVSDTNKVIKWDGHEWPAKSWNQDQTLRLAIKNSCVWVYTGFAEQIPIEKYYNYVKSFDYGNKNLIGQPTRFWLAGLLRISANQQVEFLQKFYNYNLPVSHRSIDIVKDIIVIEQNNLYKLNGKTGGGMLTDTDYIMWLVGYIEKGNKVYYYAMNFISNDFNRTSPARYDITKSILRELNLVQ